ncbi:MAG: xanthine dehydrogenase family protein [Chloroflexi bacterium]|nr:xanthine dehydrogenase family protein [Chloroflexota bacterium]
MVETGRLIGAAVPAVESQRFVRGQGSFVDDLRLPGTLHVAFVRSPHAHARLLGIEAGAARARPGVVGVWSGAEIAQRVQPTVIELPVPGLRPVRFWPLAVDKARFAGDAVAAVVADDRYHAEDGADAVAVEYAPLPAVAHSLRALDPGAPRVDDELPDNLVFDHTLAHGDVDGAFARAARVVSGVFGPQRITNVPLEGRGCVAQWDGRRLTLWASTRLPHLWRLAIARALGLTEGDVRVIVPDVGGAFGQKITPAREEMAVCALAVALRRPVKWIEDRRENLSASNHARGERLALDAALAADGTLLALRGDLLSDSGAYCIVAASALPMIAATMLPGPYRVPALRVRVRAVHTHTCPLGAYRAPWAVETLARECLLDEAARELGVDPVVLRERNLLRRDEIPCRNAAGVPYEAVVPDESFRAALAGVDYEAVRAEQRRAAPGTRRVGLGLCVALEPTAFGTGYLAQICIPRGGHE